MGGGLGAGRLAYEVTAIALELFPSISFPTLDSLNGAIAREGGRSSNPQDLNENASLGLLDARFRGT